MGDQTCTTKGSSKFHQGSLQTFHGRLGNPRTIHGKWMQLGSLSDNRKKLGTYDH